jgi:hypothetical protein
MKNRVYRSPILLNRKIPSFSRHKKYPLICNKEWYEKALEIYNGFNSLLKNIGVNYNFLYYYEKKYTYRLFSNYKKKTQSPIFFSHFIEKYCELSKNYYYSSKKLFKAISIFLRNNGFTRSALTMYLSRYYNIKISKTSKTYLGIILNPRGESEFFPNSIQSIKNKIKTDFHSRDLCKIMDCKPTINKFFKYYENIPSPYKDNMDKEKIVKLIKQIEKNLFILNKKRIPDIKIGLALKVLTPFSDSIIENLLNKRNIGVSIRSLKNLFLKSPSFKDYLQKNEIKTMPNEKIKSLNRVVLIKSIKDLILNLNKPIKKN